MRKRGRLVVFGVLALLVATVLPPVADGAPAEADVGAPTQPLVGVADVAAGEWHGCAVTDAGGVLCWGFNNAGQLGDGTTTDRDVAAPVIGLDATIVAAEAGGGHTCALTEGGGVKCWGYNSNGQLGDGSRTSRRTPVDVLGLTSGVVDVATGYHHTCAMLDTGGVKCWGRNGFGQVGDGSGTDRLSPVDVVGLTSGVAGIATGFDHSCAVTDGGAVQCWGQNVRGQLGDGTTTDRTAPVQVSGLTSSASSLTLGWLHSCARTTAGGAKCWGNNNYGQLGDGTTVTRHTPVDVTGLPSTLSAVSAGYWHTCGITDGGVAICWGLNQSGQVGDGTTENRLSPVGVIGLGSGVSAMASGFEHTCVIASGAARCWGKNQFSQLGDGTSTNRTTPVDVLVVTPPEPPTVIPGHVSIDEGNDGTTDVAVPVELSHATDLPVSVEWTTLDHTATSPSDFVAASGLANFAPGEVSTTVTVSVNGDEMLESDEVALVSFRNATNATIGGLWGLGTLTISNDDAPPVATPGFATVVEGDRGSSVLEVEVRLSAPSAFPVELDWVTFDLTATAPRDYEAANGTLIIQPGDSVGVVPVIVNGDRRREPDEWLVVSFRDPVGATLGGFYGLGLGVIVNDDGP